MKNLSQQQIELIQLENTIRLELLQLYPELCMAFTQENLEFWIASQTKISITRNSIQNKEQIKNIVAEYIYEIEAEDRMEQVGKDIQYLIHKIDPRLYASLLSHHFLVFLPQGITDICRIPLSELENKGTPYIENLVKSYLQREDYALQQKKI